MSETIAQTDEPIDISARPRATAAPRQRHGFELLGNPQIRFSAEFDKLAAALNAAQRQIGRASKDSSNPHFSSKYADLGSVFDACFDPLVEAGITVLQPVTTDRDNPRLVTITTMLVYGDQWMTSELVMLAADARPQVIGSCATYGRRYSLAPLVGVVPEEGDDDGNRASGRRSPETTSATGATKQAEVTLLGIRTGTGANKKPYTYLAVQTPTREHKHFLNDGEATVDEILTAVGSELSGYDRATPAEFPEPVPCRVTLERKGRFYTITEFRPLVAEGA